MSILKVDTINEKTSGNGVQIAGHVVQVKQTEMDNRTHITSTSLVSVGSGCELQITPKFSSSKMLVTFSMPVILSDTRTTASQLFRDSTSINLNVFYVEETSGDWQTMTVVHNFLDSPNTTSQITYSAKFQISNGSCYLNYSNTNLGLQSSSGRATMTAMEIAQ